MHVEEAGPVVGKMYQVTAHLGQGGMGAVYLARHTLTGQRFALKFLAPSLTGQTSAAQGLVREALAAGRVQHENVVSTVDVGEYEGRVYLVMEYLEGRALSELLDTGDLSDRAALSIVLRAMEGVAAGHDQGVLHRDLKPENIFVCVGASGALDDARVMDFGLASLPEQLNAGEDTNSGVVVGTPHFMCVEQLTGRLDLDERVDVYALGVSLYRIFSGRAPFEGDDFFALSSAISHEEPIHLSALRPDLPRVLSDVVMKAMARERDARHPSVRVLARDLEPFVASLSHLTARQRLTRFAAPAGPGATPSRPPSVALGTVRPAPRQRFSWLYVAAVPPLLLATWWMVRNAQVVDRAPEAPPASVEAAALAAPAPPPTVKPTASSPRAVSVEALPRLPSAMPERPSTRQESSRAPAESPRRARQQSGRAEQGATAVIPQAPAPPPPALEAVSVAPEKLEPGDDLLHVGNTQARIVPKLDVTDPYGK